VDFADRDIRHPSRSGVVLGLVKKQELRRKRIEGRWAYRR
jgi:hypothetical protein